MVALGLLLAGLISDWRLRTVQDKFHKLLPAQTSQEERRRAVAPLDRRGHIDPDLWHKYRDHCHVRRFWAGSDDEIGRLIHKPGGAEHAGWAFHYGPAANEDDEAGYRFGTHVFAPGEYVSVRDHDNDEIHNFRVAAVESAA
jgi:hypothetical protein